MSHCHGLGFNVALLSAAWSLYIVTFRYLSVDSSLGWALADMILISLDLRKSTLLISILEANFMRF